jgi:hypothetical protein
MANFILALGNVSSVDHTPDTTNSSTDAATNTPHTIAVHT